MREVRLPDVYPHVVSSQAFPDFNVLKVIGRVTLRRCTCLYVDNIKVLLRQRLI